MDLAHAHFSQSKKTHEPGTAVVNEFCEPNIPTKLDNMTFPLSKVVLCKDPVYTNHLIQQDKSLSICHSKFVLFIQFKDVASI